MRDARYKVKENRDIPFLAEDGALHGVNVREDWIDTNPKKQRASSTDGADG